MIDLIRIGWNSTHDESFEVDRPNGHPVYLLLLVKSPARFLVQDTWQTTAPDTAFLFKPGQKHRYCADHCTYINDWAHIRSAAPLMGEHFPFGKPIALHHPEDYYNLFHLIYNEFYGVAPNRNFIINNLMTALLAKLADESNTEEYPDIYYDLAALREQIYKFPAKEWSIESMASQLSVSTGYLHSLYRHYFNTTCMSDVIQSRIQYSCELLTCNRKPLGEISEMCGYHSVEHFIRQFKSVNGTTPGKYRK